MLKYSLLFGTIFLSFFLVYRSLNSFTENIVEETVSEIIHHDANIPPISVNNCSENLNQIDFLSADVNIDDNSRIFKTCRRYFDDQFLRLHNVKIHHIGNGETQMYLNNLQNYDYLYSRNIKHDCHRLSADAIVWTKIPLTISHSWGNFPPCHNHVNSDTVVFVASKVYFNNLFHFNNNFLIPLFVEVLLSGVDYYTNTYRPLKRILVLHDKGQPVKEVLPTQLLKRLFTDIVDYNAFFSHPHCVRKLVWPQFSGKHIFYNNVAPWGNDLFWRGILLAFRTWVHDNVIPYPTARDDNMFNPVNMHLFLFKYFSLQKVNRASQFKILYVSRSLTDGERRYIDRTSIADLKNQIESHDTNGSYQIEMKIVWPDDYRKYKLAEWLQLLRSTNALIGPFGSGFANLIYMESGSMVYVFGTTNYPFNPDFLSMARHNLVRYYCADFRNFPFYNGIGVRVTSAIISRMITEITSHITMFMQTDVVSIRDEHSAPCIHGNAHRQCYRHSDWAKNNELVFNSWQSGTCYFSTRKNRECFGIAHPKAKACHLVFPNRLC